VEKLQVVVANGKERNLRVVLAEEKKANDDLIVDQEVELD
jgi:arginine/ornithine N-succinyltransferase beta subunit